MLWLRARPEKEIVVGTHSAPELSFEGIFRGQTWVYGRGPEAFLMAVFNVALEIGEDSMKSFFKTGRRL